MSSENLQELLVRFPPPGGTRVPEPYEDALEPAGIRLRVAGVAGDCHGECVTGSAAECDADPLPRAYFEWLERAAIVSAIAAGGEAPTRDARGGRLGLLDVAVVFPPRAEDGVGVAWSRSNGVAIGASWGEAAARAELELIERDAVLRSFYGDTVPVDLGVPAGVVPRALLDAYDVRVVSLASQSRFSVAGVLALPRGPSPFACGFAARASVTDAARDAGRECLQSLAFLWGEELPSVAPRAAPSPSFHQEHYLFPGNHERVREWLAGGHSRFRGVLRAPRGGAVSRYADLTPESLRGRLTVVKALPDEHVPLAFGEWHPYLRLPFPSELRVHPIA